MKKKFHEKLQNKTNIELHEIILNEKSYQKEAVSLAKKILFIRNNNTEKQLERKEALFNPEKTKHEFKHSLEENKDLKLTYKKKSTALFIEYFVFSFIFLIIFQLFVMNSDEYEFNDFIKIYFICFFIYYSASEFLLKKTLVMRYFGIELANLSKFNFLFIIYSLASILDRTIFAPFHLMLAFFNYEKLLYCEKVSGIRWKLNEK